MIRTILYVLMAEVWNTVGQLLFKTAANTFPPLQGRGWGSYGVFLGTVIRQPRILLGLLFMTGGLIFWIAALSQMALSVVFVLGSMQYILILIASRVFLGEKIDAMRFLGTFFIAAGITLVALASAG